MPLEMFGDHNHIIKSSTMCVEKVLFSNPLFHVAIIERSGKWSAEIGNRVYHWNCSTKVEAIEKTMQQVIEINEQQTKLFFQEHFLP